jgi:hypothetical protein
MEGKKEALEVLEGLKAEARQAWLLLLEARAKRLETKALFEAWLQRHENAKKTEAQIERKGVLK